MIYRILQQAEIVNTIEADELFVAQYCAQNGYAYELEERAESETEPEPAPPEPTAEDIALDMLADHEERLCMLELTTL
mgnify:CR=1 FL=1|jgi:hypothetical protein